MHAHDDLLSRLGTTVNAHYLVRKYLKSVVSNYNSITAAQNAMIR